jgi:DNA helicase-2/ATP-dependent DNA helicase PcrA
MNINLLEEKKILKEKRDIIKFELEKKRSDALNIENKLNNLRKETKGKYDVEKEAVEKISEVYLRTLIAIKAL